MDQEQRRLYNSKNCSANVRLEFRGSVIVDSKSRDGKDYVCLDLVFSENVKIRLFNPEKSIRDRSIMSVLLSSLFEALGDDFGDIPPCRGGFFEFLSEVTETMNRRKYTMLYAKLTVNEAGYIICGEGRSFSKNPDLEYTDSDLHFLTVDEPVKSRPQEDFMPEFEDISFEVVEEPTQEVTVYSAVTTVNDIIPLKEVGALNRADILSIEMTDESAPVLDFLADGVQVEQEYMDTSDTVKVFDGPSDLDDIFSKPPEKSVVQEIEEKVAAQIQEERNEEPFIAVKDKGELKSILMDDEPFMECGDNTVLYDSPYVKKSKKKEPKPKIPKGSDPLRYIHGDPEGEDWGVRENKIINMEDLPQ